MDSIALSLGTAILVSILTYLTKMQKGEAFDGIKFFRTFFIGAVIGIVAWYQGIEVTQENFGALLTANAGIIGMLDQAWKLIYRLVKKSD